MKSRLFVLTLGVCLAACGGDDPSGPPYASLTGDWRGSLAGLTFRMDVTDDDGLISGTGTLSGTATLSFNVAGDHDHPDVDFEGIATGFENFEFDGRFLHEDTVRGRVNGSGFSDDVLLLIRQ